MPHRLIGEDDGDNQQQSLRRPAPTNHAAIPCSHWMLAAKWSLNSRQTDQFFAAPQL
jgi:hypothetical protein